MESSTEKDIVRQIKEDLCYVSANPEEERIDEAKLYVLPDGNSISIKEELFRAPEILFQPSMIGLEHGGIPDAIFDSVTKCDIDIRKEMLGNVVLSGGTTMFPGFPERVAQDLKALSAHTSHASVNVSAKYLSISCVRGVVSNSGFGTSGSKGVCLERRINLGFPLNLSEDVDHQSRI